jgi:hypothetical protein
VRATRIAGEKSDGVVECQKHVRITWLLPHKNVRQPVLTGDLIALRYA